MKSCFKRFCFFVRLVFFFFFFFFRWVDYNCSHLVRNVKELGLKWIENQKEIKQDKSLKWRNLQKKKKKKNYWFGNVFRSQNPFSIFKHVHKSFIQCKSTQHICIICLQECILKVGGLRNENLNIISTICQKNTLQKDWRFNPWCKQKKNYNQIKMENWRCNWSGGGWRIMKMFLSGTEVKESMKNDDYQH